MALEQYRTTHYLLANNKIIISDIEILLNPKGLDELLKSVAYLGEKGLFYIPLKVMVGGQLHQAIARKDGVAFIMTTKYKIDLGGYKITSKSLSLEKIDQRFHVSKLNLDELEYEPGFIPNFFIKKRIFDYEEFSGFILRLNIIFRVERSDTAVAQGHKIFVEKAARDERHLWEIYENSKPSVTDKN